MKNTAIIKQIVPIADLSEVKSRLDNDKKIIETYEGLIVVLEEELKKPMLPKIDYWRIKEELLRHDQTLSAKKVAFSNLQQRADEWEVQFEENSRIVNEGFDSVMEFSVARSKSPLATNILKGLIDGYEASKDSVLSDQQVKNNLYYQLVEQLNGRNKR